MWSATIVVGQEAWERSAAFERRRVRHRIGPFPQERLDESFRFAVGARRIGARPPMADVQPFASRAKAARDVAAAVVAQDPAHADPARPKPADRARQEGPARRAELIAEDFDIGDPAVIIDRHVHILPADSRAGPAAIAVDPMAHTPDAAQGFDVDVNHVPRPRPLVPVNRDDRRDGRAVKPSRRNQTVTVDRGIWSAWPIAHAGRPCCSRSH